MKCSARVPKHTLAAMKSSLLDYSENNSSVILKMKDASLTRFLSFKKNKNQQVVSFLVILFGFGFKKHKSTEQDHWMALHPPSAGSIWISIKEATASFSSCGKKLWTGESCPGWLHLIPVLSPTLSCQITPMFLPIISLGGGALWLEGHRERGKRAETQRLYWGRKSLFQQPLRTW